MSDPAPKAELDELFSEYDELTDGVASSGYQLFPGNLNRWLTFLDTSTPFARPIGQQLEPAAYFESWFAPYRLALQGHPSRELAWPDEKYKRLGTQLLLFRQFANGGIDPKLFAFLILRSGKNANDGNASIISQIFIPASRELRRFLRKVAEPLPPVATEMQISSILHELGADFPHEQVAVTGAEQAMTLKHEELLILKPAFMGISINLNEAFRRAQSWWHSRRQKT